jgi:hypothetical protein
MGEVSPQQRSDDRKFSLRRKRGRQLTSSPKVRIRKRHLEMFEKGYVTADMVAVKVGVHFSTVLRWSRDKRYVEASRLEGQYYMPRKDIVAFVRREQPMLEKLRGIDLDNWSNIFVEDGGDTYLRTEEE